MRKILLSITCFVSLFIFNANVNASSPTAFEDVYSSSNLKAGATLKIDTYIKSGNSLNYMCAGEKVYSYDSKSFDFKTFKTDYGFSFNNTTGIITATSKDGWFFPTYVNAGDEKELLWTFTFSVKKDIIITDEIKASFNSKCEADKVIVDPKTTECKTCKTCDKCTISTCKEYIILFSSIALLLGFIIGILIKKKNKQIPTIQ